MSGSATMFVLKSQLYWLKTKTIIGRFMETSGRIVVRTDESANKEPKEKEKDDESTANRKGNDMRSRSSTIPDLGLALVYGRSN